MPLFNVLPLTTVPEGDFDSFFASSYPYFEANNFPWLPGNDTADQRKQQLWEFAQAILARGDYFGYKTMCDGRQVSCVLGVMRGSDFYICLSLLREDAGGSRAWVYDPFCLVAEKTYAKASGVCRIFDYIAKESPLRDKIPTLHGIDPVFEECLTMVGADSKVDMYCRCVVSSDPS